MNRDAMDCLDLQANGTISQLAFPSVKAADGEMVYGFEGLQYRVTDAITTGETSIT
jgi:hypothetical protein